MNFKKLLKKCLPLFSVIGLCSCNGVVALNNNVSKVRAQENQTYYFTDLSEGFGDDIKFYTNDYDVPVDLPNTSTLKLTRTYNSLTKSYEVYLKCFDSQNVVNINFKYLRFNFETSNFNSISNQPNQFIVNTFINDELYANYSLNSIEFFDFIDIYTADSYVGDLYGSDYDNGICTYEPGNNLYDINVTFRNTYNLQLNSFEKGIYLFNYSITYYYGAQDVALSDNYDNAYQSGYNSGYEVGQAYGYDEGVTDLYNGAYQGMSYQQIYNYGFSQGASSVSTSRLPSLFGAIVNVPLSVLNGLMDLTYFDISVVRIVMTVLVLNVILYLISYLMSAKG